MQQYQYDGKTDSYDDMIFYRKWIREYVSSYEYP